VRRGDAQIAGEQKLGASAERDAVDGADRRLRKRREVVHRAPDVLDEDRHALERHRLALLQVGAGAEGLVARAGDDDRAHGEVLRELEEERAQPLERRE
jgi:hypothetical protein